SVTATCDQVPIGRAAGASTIRSSPPPFGVIANRSFALPADGDRNAYLVVFWPKSKIRCHAVPPYHFTQLEKLRMLSTPPGRFTYWLAPARSRIAPRITATRGRVP